MDPVKMERIQQLFHRRARETAKAIKEMDAIEFSKSPTELNRVAALRIVDCIRVETDNILVMCDAGGLDAYYVEIQTNLITDQVLLLTRHVQNAMPNAGMTLHCVLHFSMKLIRDSAMSLVKDIIAAAAQGYSRTHREVLEDDIARVRFEVENLKAVIQLTNATAIASMLSFIKENLKFGASTMHARRGILLMMARQIGHEAASLIEKLPSCGFLSSEVRSFIRMEELMKKFIIMYDLISRMYRGLLPIEQITLIGKIFDEIQRCISADYGDSKLKS